MGDISAADVVKFHIQSPKLTLLMMDDFFGQAIPELRSRIKVSLQTHWGALRKILRKIES
jgi:hypothetical protein